MSDDIATRIERLTARIGDPVQGPPNIAPCGFPPWTYGSGDEGETCAGEHHMRARAYLRVCPYVAAERTRALVAAESERLRGALDRMGGGVPTWAQFDQGRVEGGSALVSALQRFASSRSPARGVYIVGTVGTGKSRAVLTAHFARLSAGFPSVYVTASNLRPVFRAASSHADDVAWAARSTIAALAAAPVLMVDDLGDVTGSPAFHQDFAAGFKSLLDAHAGKLVVANNLDARASAEHPDIGPRIVSRLVEGADIVRLKGRDQRMLNLRIAK